jgi:hypothetical protein
MKNHITKTIAEWLKTETTEYPNNAVQASSIEFNRLSMKSETHAGFCEKIAAEITRELLNLFPSNLQKNSLSDDVKLSFHKGVALYQCIQNYELGVFTKDEFIKEMRRIDCEKDYPYPVLFDHMANEHGLTLTNTELGDIIHIAREK